MLKLHTVFSFKNHQTLAIDLHVQKWMAAALPGYQAIRSCFLYLIWCRFWVVVAQQHSLTAFKECKMSIIYWSIDLYSRAITARSRLRPATVNSPGATEGYGVPHPFAFYFNKQKKGNRSISVIVATCVCTERIVPEFPPVCRKLYKQMSNWWSLKPNKFALPSAWTYVSRVCTLTLAEYTWQRNVKFGRALT